LKKYSSSHAVAKVPVPLARREISSTMKRNSGILLRCTGEEGRERESRGYNELVLGTHNMASFVRCTHEVTNNGMYMPVTCLSTSYSFVYVLTGRDSDIVENLEPSCGYLAMTPLGSGYTPQPVNASYADTIEFMRNGFAVLFPLPGSITECLVESIRLVRYLNIYAVLFYYLMFIHFDLY
jgi:hypothetical protein